MSEHDGKQFTRVPHKDAETAARLPLVPAVRIESGATLLYISGVLAAPDGFDDDGAPLPPPDIVEETHRVLSDIGRQLEEAGATFEDVVRVQKFLTDLDEHPQVVQVMREYFGTVWPTSTTIEVPRLVYRGFRLEIDAVAVIPES